MDRDFVRRWVLANLAGAAVGSLIPPLVGQLLTTSASEGGPGPSTGVVLISMMLVGAAEGAVLGVAQWSALKGRLPALTAFLWVSATGWAFACGWLMAAVSSPAEPDMPITSGWVLLLAATNGLLLGATVGGIQAYVLRRQMQKPIRWVWVNIVAWPCSLLGMKICQDLIPMGADGVHWTLATGLGGLISGFMVGAITGPLLDASLPGSESARPPDNQITDN